MSLATVKPAHLRRYKDIVMLLLKYGRSSVASGNLLDTLDDNVAGADEVEEGRPEELAADLEKLGPTFIKLGQLLSTRADLLPPAYLEGLRKLQDDVEPFPFEEVNEIVERELGVSISKAFSHFEERPLAAASLGQVHRATLRDGREVAVKVQRPGIRAEVAEDFEALEKIAEFLDRHTEAGKVYGFALMLDEFKRSLQRELDYRAEAGHLRRFGANLSHFEHIVVPCPVDDYTSSRVLTMEYVGGVKIDSLSPVVRLELGGEALADELFRAYLQQILVDGLFHADPHPGNVFLTQDRRIALIDFGMVGRVPPATQKQLLKLLLAVSEGDGEAAARIAIEISEKREDFDEMRFCREISELVGRHQDLNLEQIEVGRVVLELCATAGANGVRVPPELLLLGKTLLNLDKIGYCLDPDFDPNAAIRRHAGEMVSRHTGEESSLSRLLSTLMETKEFFEELPGRVNRLLDTLANNELRVKVDAIDERALHVAVQKVANRITVGLVLAAQIVGAALLMRIETRFTLFGYPGLAIILFLMAAAGGFWLIWQVMWHDRKPRT